MSKQKIEVQVKDLHSEDEILFGQMMSQRLVVGEIDFQSAVEAPGGATLVPVETDLLANVWLPKDSVFMVLREVPDPEFAPGTLVKSTILLVRTATKDEWARVDNLGATGWNDRQVQEFIDNGTITPVFDPTKPVITEPVVLDTLDGTVEGVFTDKDGDYWVVKDGLAQVQYKSKGEPKPGSVFNGGDPVSNVHRAYKPYTFVRPLDGETLTRWSA